MSRLKGTMILTVAFGIAYIMIPVPVWAGPPVPDDRILDSLAEEDYSGEAVVFGEDYVDLISELESVLSEFEKFFEEYGYASLKEYEKAIKKLRRTLTEDYSVESHKETMRAIDEFLARVDSVETESTGKESASQRRYQRSLRSLQEDLKEIQEEMQLEFEGAQLRYNLDSRTISRIIQKSFEKAQQALEEAQRAQRHLIIVPPDAPEPESILIIPPAPPVPPKWATKREAEKYYRQALAMSKADFDGSLSKAATASVPNRTALVELENAIGGVGVTTWNKSEIAATLTVSYSESSQKSRDLAQQIRLNIKTSESAVALQVIYPDEGESVNIVSSQLDITVPRANPISINNSFGPVTVRDLDNTVHITSNFSDVDLQAITGNVTLSNSSGAVYLEDITGALDVTNSFAPIEVVFVRGETKLSNSYAPITVKKSSGRLDISGSGMIVVNRHEGDVTIHSSNGEIDIYGITGNLIATNSFGQVQVEEVSGTAEIENANALTEVSRIKGALIVSNKFAPVIVDNAESDVTVRSSNGTVRVESVGGMVTVTNRFGEVTVTSAGGPVHITNANASVSVMKVTAPVTVINQFSPVYLEAITGNISVENSNSSVDLINITGISTVNTTSGTISGEDLNGTFRIGNNNGSVELLRVIGINDDCEVSTTFGDITVQLPLAETYNLMATISNGDIESDVPMKVVSSGSVSTGEYTSGKANPTIRLTGQNGSIRILTR